MREAKSYFIPKLGSYGIYSSPNNHACKVEIGDLTLYYSYNTVVAFSTIESGLVVCENAWGTTTGKHINWINKDKKIRVPVEQFRKRLRQVLAKYLVGDSVLTEITWKCWCGVDCHSTLEFSAHYSHSHNFNINGRVSDRKLISHMERCDSFCTIFEVTLPHNEGKATQIISGYGLDEAWEQAMDILKESVQ